MQANNRYSVSKIANDEDHARSPAAMMFRWCDIQPQAPWSRLSDGQTGYKIVMDWLWKPYEASFGCLSNPAPHNYYIWKNRQEKLASSWDSLCMVLREAGSVIRLADAIQIFLNVSY